MVKIHRIREFVPNRKGEFIFPVAIRRHKRLLAPDDDFNAPTDDEMPVLTATSDDEADGPDTDADEPSGSYTLLFGPADPRIDADAVPPIRTTNLDLLQRTHRHCKVGWCPQEIPRA